MPIPTQTVPRRRRQQRRRRRFPLIPFLVLLVAVLAVIKWIDPFAPKPAAQQQTPQTPDWVTVELLPVNPYSRPGIPLEQVNGIVIHYVGNPGTTAAQNHSYFENLAQTGETYASSHFLVGLEGEVIQNVPLDEIAYCSNQRNEDTISIECCHPDDSGAFNQATYDSLVQLTRWLMEAYDLDTDQVIRHYDVTGKICPKSFVENPEEWEQFLKDLEQ
ncbi:N-acetylmuramoyl-L-alanine amidase family protein [Pseudoflavonifractor phocaeensis]|uniref:peptidoglycan recognition protein family protein n=1 Tax=Pseudoflavonifractor phocaeensis TaxID=1870988 RepID=UPI00195E930D|nr:peptidoglycan recognition family protein [Pseudoflavonifractor phocaeensis]MBM6722337.1 N-acetylmuramoyl-L-alanine amidase [Pseudoflavonifractor phocaeensis]